MKESLKRLPAEPLVIATIFLSILLVASIWIALTSTEGRMHRISLSVSTYDSLTKLGDTKRNLEGAPMSVAQVIDHLVSQDKGSTACSAPKLAN